MKQQAEKVVQRVKFIVNVNHQTRVGARSEAFEYASEEKAMPSVLAGLL